MPNLRNVKLLVQCFRDLQYCSLVVMHFRRSKWPFPFSISFPIDVNHLFGVNVMHFGGGCFLSDSQVDASFCDNRFKFFPSQSKRVYFFVVNWVRFEG